MSRASIFAYRFSIILCVWSVLAFVVASPVPSQEPEIATAAEHKTERIHELIERAKKGLERVGGEIKDYECLMTKRERVDGKVQPIQYLEAKIRHEQKEGDKVTVPFSVYLKFLKPDRIQGREVIYVEGKYDGDLIGRRGGRRSPNMTVQLDPAGPMAMDGNRYPITEIGFATMVERLIEVMEKEIDADSCEIKIFSKAKLNGRECTHYELTMAKESADSEFMRALMFVDNEYRVPVYYAAYDWPKEEGGEPLLLEEYSYTRIKLNVGLTDKDFDPANPNYNFSDVEPAPTGGDDG
jgi:hypothetical protein